MGTLGKESKGGFEHGSKSSIGVSALQLTATSYPADKGVLVKADPDNGSGLVSVGNSDVTHDSTDATDGYLLQAGEEVVIPIDNANKVYVIGSTTGLKVFFVVL